MKLSKKTWIARIVISLSFLACHGKPIPLVEERVLNPFSYDCRCTKLTDAELNHLILVGDQRWDRMVRERQACIDAGLLRETLDKP